MFDQSSDGTAGGDFLPVGKKKTGGRFRPLTEQAVYISISSKTQHDQTP